MVSEHVVDDGARLPRSNQFTLDFFLSFPVSTMIVFDLYWPLSHMLDANNYDERLVKKKAINNKTILFSKR